MPLSFPKLEPVVVNGATKWTATCRTCGWTLQPQVVKAAAEETRRAHGPEKLCTRGGQE